MGFTELLFLSIGLAMDAFAVSVCKGLSTKKVSAGQMAAAGLWFGGFQAFMPALGFFLGAAFQKYITSFDHWIAFALLCLIGGNMLREAFSKESECCPADEKGLFSPRAMLPLAIATSIDALAVGVTFAFLEVNLPLAIGMIGCVTFVFSAAGVKIGNLFGSRFKAKAEAFGGILLILLGIKILLEHLGFFG